MKYCVCENTFHQKKKKRFQRFPQRILPHCERLVNGRFVNADLRVLALVAVSFSFGCGTHSTGM